MCCQRDPAVLCLVPWCICPVSEAARSDADGVEQSLNRSLRILLSQIMLSISGLSHSPSLRMVGVCLWKKMQSFAILQKGACFLADPKYILCIFNSQPIIWWGFFGLLLGEPLYESCSNKVAKMLYKKVHRAGEVKDLDFYIFSYYYDCAAEAGLIGMSAPELVSF